MDKEGLYPMKKIVLMLTFALVAACAALSQTKNPVVVINTSQGAITVELYSDKAPKSVENFMTYVKSGFYSGTIFHRVIKGFMIQGGGMTADMQPKPTKPPVVNESSNGLQNLRGTIAMARKPDPNSATSQFFINTVDNQRLAGYTVFGKVIDGMDVVDKIESVPTGNKDAYQNVPITPVVIKSVNPK